jgi:hypothetical protein
MALIIGGHVRSGTTLLRNLMNSHPEITVTMEFGNFSGLGMTYRGYGHRIIRNQLRDKNRKRSFLVQGSNENQLFQVLTSYAFVARYLYEVNRHRRGPIDVTTIELALCSIFPASRVVGDKAAYYVFRLDKLADTDGLVRVIIYRDCRDVMSSTLEAVRTTWRNMGFVGNLDTVEKVATRWVRAVELMEHYADSLHAVRYEDLIGRPGPELEALADRVGVDVDGFPGHMIHGSSVGRYRKSLSDDEVAAVVAVAGPTMSRLGYI